MRADAESFTFLTNAGSVEVPFFQRGYVWGKDNWEDLLAGLLDSKKLPFFGSLILKQEDTKAGEPKKKRTLFSLTMLATKFGMKIK